MNISLFTKKRFVLTIQYKYFIKLWLFIGREYMAVRSKEYPFSSGWAITMDLLVMMSHAGIETDRKNTMILLYKDCTICCFYCHNYTLECYWILPNFHISYITQEKFPQTCSNT